MKETLGLSLRVVKPWHHGVVATASMEIGSAVKVASGRVDFVQASRGKIKTMWDKLRRAAHLMALAWPYQPCSRQKLLRWETKGICSLYYRYCP